VLGVTVASIPTIGGNVAISAVRTRNAITTFGPVLAPWAIIVGRLGYPDSSSSTSSYMGVWPSPSHGTQER
jgi:hypothetical protein